MFKIKNYRMYDSLGICLSTNVDISKYLHYLEPKVNHKTGEFYYVGYEGNFRVKRTVQFISMYGSLAKYFFGDNISTLSINETKEAIKKLSDNLHLNLIEARIYRLDFGTNLILNQPIPKYLSRFGRLPYHSKSMYRDYQTVEYTNGLHELSVYDKLREHKNKKIPIPDEIKDQNIAKCEDRYKKRLPQRFQLPIMTAGTLCNLDFFNRLLDNLLNGYFSIEKRRVVKPVNMTELNNVTRVRNFLATVGLHYANVSISDVLHSNEIHKTSRSRIRAYIEALNLNEDLTENDDLIMEFDQKIVAAVNKYRC